MTEPTARELADFKLRMVIERMRFRIDAMNERGLSGISISHGFANEIVRTCQSAIAVLGTPVQPEDAGTLPVCEELRIDDEAAP